MEDLKRLIFPVALALLLHGLVISYQLPKQQRLKPALNGSPIKIKMNTFSPKPIVEKKVEPEAVEPKVVEAEPVKPVKEMIVPDPVPLEKSVPKEVVKPPVVIANHQKKVVIKPEPPPKVEVSEEKNLSEPPPEKIEQRRVEDQSVPQLEAVNISSEPEDTLSEREVAVAPMQKKAVPIYRQNKQPPYPVMAKRRGYQGEILLHVLVDQEGAVSELQVKKSSGHVSLDRTALKTVKNWLFTPATEGGRVVAMWVDVPISFELK
jgi:protein TonB